MAAGSPPQRDSAPFSEKAFYLSEFRGRTLALAIGGSELRSPASVESVLKELETNGARVLVMAPPGRALESLAAGRLVPAESPRLEGAVWRALGPAPRVGVAVPASRPFAATCREVAVRLGISKLVFLDPKGGLGEAARGRESFVDLEGLRGLLRGAGVDGRRLELLREIERALGEGLPAVNLCSEEGLEDELFTYAGSGTLFTRERYVVVRRLTLDDYSTADGLLARGVEEGYLAPRSESAVEQVLANGFGAFVEGRHLAGIGALIDHESARAAEIVSLYTLTRFLGEGIGAHLVRFAVERAVERRREFVFACTTVERVVGFFERQGFARVAPDRIPAEKWLDYDPARRARVICLRREVG